MSTPTQPLPDGGQPTITMGPTLTNPDALHTVDDLRQALHDANVQLMNVSQQLHNTKAVLASVARDVAKIVLAHLAKDPIALVDSLDAFCGEHVRTTHAGPTGPTGARGVH